MNPVSSAPSSVVRRASPSDALALAAFAATAFIDTYAADNTPEDMATYVAESFGEARLRSELTDPSCTILVAEWGDEVAGYIMLRQGAMPSGASVDARGKAIEVARLYAGKRWIGTGLGSTLMQTGLDLAAARGCEWIWLGVWEHNARAIAFYSRWGFTDVGTQFFQLGADRQTDRIMARRVAARE